MKRVLFVFAFLIVPAYGQTTLVQSLRGWDSYIIPGTGGKVLYGQTDLSDNYAVAQWSNPNELSGFASASCSFGSNCYKAKSANIVDTIYTGPDSNRWIDFTTTGIGLACGTEMDSLQRPLDSTYARYPSAVLGNASIGTLSHLYVFLKAEPVSFVTLDNHCSTTQGNMLFDVTLSDRSASQTMFYQPSLYKYPIASHAFWFSNTNPFGYQAVMGNYGLSPLVPGVRSDFTGNNPIDILPDIKAQITAATNGLDTNPNNWYVAGAYYGHATWGDVNSETEFCCFKVVATSGYRRAPTTALH